MCDRVQAQWTGYAPGADTCPSAAMCLVLGRLSTVVCGEKIEQSEPDGCELLDSWVALCPGRVSRVQGKLLVDSWQGRVSVDVLEAGSMIIGGWLSAVPSATSANCTQVAGMSRRRLTYIDQDCPATRCPHALVHASLATTATSHCLLKVIACLQAAADLASSS